MALARAIEEARHFQPPADRLCLTALTSLAGFLPLVFATGVPALPAG